MVDNGYDISDYMDIDPSFGTMEDMKELIAEAKKHGIRILMDLVVNHSSDQHAWFRAALKDPFGKYGKYYVFREGKDGKEPNNWRSIFGGSAWEKVPGYDNLYYLHIFTKEQPDLNWENPELREEIYEMILKWMDLGLGGFRLDAISHLKKNYQYTNLPSRRGFSTVSRYASLNSSSVGPEYSPPRIAASTERSIMLNVKSSTSIESSDLSGFFT